MALCVDQVYGYGHLPWSFIEEHEIDVEVLANERGWTLDRGVLTVSFYAKWYKHDNIQFGDKVPRQKRNPNK